MNLRLFSALTFSALVLPASPGRAGAPVSRGSASTADRQSLNLTVYNSGRALVTDRRALVFASGISALQFMGVAREIMPETVAFKSLTDPAGLAVLEQNYEYDLLSPKKLLDKYVGREVTLVFRETQNNSTSERKVTATLLANNEQPVWKIGDKIVTGDSATRYEFPALPDNLIAQPTLVWLLEGGKAAKRHEVEARYLTGGISWTADYVLTLEPDGKRGDLGGWVTIRNNSGASYPEARLQLIAGDVHQVEQPNGDKMRRMGAVADAPSPQFQEKAFFEYHLYTLERLATLTDNSQKQISLLEAEGIAIEKLYRLRGLPWYFRQQYGGGDPQKVEVALKLRNSRENRMGMALPKGTVRVYQRDRDGSSQFVGEDAIDHTPKDEAVTLVIGNAFDIAAERKQTDFKPLDGCTYESAFEISLRNHKTEPAMVQVEEPVGGEWTMLSNSAPFEKTSAFSALFKVPVAADGETKLKYRVRSRYCR